MITPSSRISWGLTQRLYALSVLASIGLLAAVGSTGMLGGALYYQYVKGLAPCEMCHWQRWPHIAAIVVGLLAALWSGSAWLLNSADSCTALASASVALGNPRSATGAASAATSSAGALAITNGSGSITLAAPSPAGSTLSLDIALNLGSTGADQSCNAAHPATTGAALPWLRAQNGSCAATADRDPAARASFGIFAPETRRTVHVRDQFWQRQVALLASLVCLDEIYSN